MQLLFSMTGATPETRLILITWLVRLGANFQSGSRDTLAKALGVSKRNLGIALEYLVREGYLWKIKSHLGQLERSNSKIRFDYAVTNECLKMWGECFLSSDWQAELISVLCGK